MKPNMNRKGLYALVCALMGLTFGMLTSCSDDLDVPLRFRMLPLCFSSKFRGFLVVFPFGNCILPYLLAYSKRLNIQNIRRYFRCIFGGSDTG